MTNKKLTSFAGIEKGMKFRVINTSNGHNYPVNTVLTFKRNGSGIDTMCDCAEEVPQGNALHIHQIEILTEVSLSNMKAKLKSLEENYKKEKAELSSKIKFCEENGLEIYDDDIFKISEALKVIESSKSGVEKAKMIAKLIKEI